MIDTDYKTSLVSLYDLAAAGRAGLDLSEQVKKQVDVILTAAENHKGVLAVVITSLFYKLHHPEQDIRKYQTKMAGGYSGRTFDTKHITPFLKENKFPAPQGTGWLTRTLESSQPYTLDYAPAITPESLKRAFLRLIDFVEKGINCADCLVYVFQQLIIQRDAKPTQLPRPNGLSIQRLVDCISKLFRHKYTTAGASRLPVIALYAVYDCLAVEIKRFNRKTLLPLESHTSADARSGRIGDIEIRDADYHPFEGVEVKYDISISLAIVRDAVEKFNTTKTERYYILSTVGVSAADSEAIQVIIDQVKSTQGCQLIVGGVEDSLKYYLRMLDDPSVFVDKFVALLESDKVIKYEHKKQWESIIKEPMKFGLS